MIKLKSLIRENAEVVRYKDVSLKFNSLDVDAVFTIYTGYDFWVLYKNEGGTYRPYSSNNEIRRNLRSFDNPPIHKLIHSQLLNKFVGKSPDGYKNEISGRIWNIKKYNEIIISFWNNMKDVTSPSISKRVIDMLTKCGYDYTKLLYEFENEEGEFYNYDKKLFVPSEEDTAKEREMNNRKGSLQRLLHTMDPAIKKRLMSMPDIDKKGKIAAELGFRNSAELDNYLNQGGE